MPEEQFSLSAILDDLRQGHPTARKRLFAILYEELGKLARRHLRKNKGRHTLRPSDLLHEAFLRLQGVDSIEWKSKTQFLAYAAQVMRRTLVDHAREQKREKRGGDAARVTVHSGMAEPAPPIDILELHDALEKLARINSRQAKVVELRFFAGMSTREVAELLGVGERTVRDDFLCARAFLRSELYPDNS
jgi:RNA polymerase sigma factor (TIGR02999 family)